MFKGSLVFAVIFLTGCTATLKSDLDRLKRSIDDVRKMQAEQTTQLAAFESDMRQLVGRVEELEHIQDQRLGRDVSSLRNHLNTLKRRVPPPAIVPLAALDQDEVYAQNLPGDVAQPFGEGLTKIREGDFDGALALLQTALDSSFGSESSGYVLFWSGVSNDGLRDDRQALAAYNEVVSKYSKHPRAPLALLRQAAVFARLGDKNLSNLTLKKLIAEHPKSSEAREAKIQLRG